ncbi:hypothetical protein AFA91_19250 [Mycolicibacterium goodii]|uniref:Uncharacterized protein n=1 Tax=Mycolicibacterium goodii TaxID=134601 RepID=A0A0K0X8H9_MYCGD|nr:hypothetical protein AFA91_19250 [Mycolicibacterium goodii]
MATRIPLLVSIAGSSASFSKSETANLTVSPAGPESVADPAHAVATIRHVIDAMVKNAERFLPSLAI